MARIQHNPELVASIEKVLTGTEALTGGENASAPFYAFVEEKTGANQELTDKIADTLPEYAASAVEAIGRVGIKNLHDHKKLDNVTGELPMGRFGTASAVVHRTKEITIPPREKGGEATKEVRHGLLQPKVDFNAGRNGGFMAKAKENIAALSDELLGKK